MELEAALELLFPVGMRGAGAERADFALPAQWLCFTEIYKDI